jgi:hypothetical protein
MRLVVETQGTQGVAVAQCLICHRMAWSTERLRSPRRPHLDTTDLWLSASNILGLQP